MSTPNHRTNSSCTILWTSTAVLASRSRGRMVLTSVSYSSSGAPMAIRPIGSASRRRRDTFEYKLPYTVLSNWCRFRRLSVIFWLTGSYLDVQGYERSARLLSGTSVSRFFGCTLPRYERSHTSTLWPWNQISAMQRNGIHQDEHIIFFLQLDDQTVDLIAGMGHLTLPHGQPHSHTVPLSSQRHNGRNNRA